MSKKITFSSPRLALILTALIATASTVFAQQITVVDFIRPGERTLEEAYIVDFVDRAPQFPGGEAAMIHFINTERNYPRDAFEARQQGRVMCAFIVDVDGSILNISIQRGPCQSLNNEAARIIASMPRWEAGVLNGRKVPVCYFLTIPFRL
ncbi:MAG: energy transducer TonB [Barnesiella sp.]|nr:energy transducer TonB [Barnesiella sp.]